MHYLILLSFIFVIEAWLEQVIIKLKNPNLDNYVKLNHQEHFRSAVWAATIILSFCCILIDHKAWWLLIGAVVARRIFFDYADIIFRDRPRNLYEGDDWWQKQLSAIFGKKGRKKELILTIIIYIVCIILHFRSHNQPW